jgi:hypothetical protein
MDFGREQEPSAEERAREERIKRLILAAVSRCSACRRRYELANFAVIGHRDHLWMVTVICDRCHNQGFITAVIEGHDLDGPGAQRQPISELTPAERARLANTQPIATDDLLDLHLFLDEFDGDFAALFVKGEARE